MIEVTYCQHNVNAQQESTLSLLQLIPSIKCAGPEGPLKADEGIHNLSFMCIHDSMYCNYL